VFYEEINRRLDDADRGIADTVFLNSPGRDSIDRIVGSLRAVGVPAVAVVDLDVITSSAKSTWKKLLSSCGVPTSRQAFLSNERTAIANLFTQMPNPNAIKDGGLDHLQPADRQHAEALLAELRSYGLFLVPPGELESWLSAYGVSKHGPDWLIRMFAAIGLTPNDANYIQADSDDVWAFMDQIADWIDNPARLGLN
jgi:hypothetical protein